MGLLFESRLEFFFFKLLALKNSIPSENLVFIIGQKSKIK